MDDDGVVPLALPILGLDHSGVRAQALEEALRHLHGVVRAYVSPHTALAYVEYQEAQLTEDQLVGAVAGAGYRVDPRQRRFRWRRG